MSDLRLISRIDIKGENVVKGFQMEGLRKIGIPKIIASQYYNEGIDEIVINDVVASLYDRKQIIELIRVAASDFFIPLTVIGGIRSLEDARKLFMNGADKIGVNTAALNNPNLLKEISDNYGRQALVLSVEAKKDKNGHWLAYSNSGRTNSGKMVSAWIEESLSYGVGEILLTSVDRDGTLNGFDMELLISISDSIPVPLLIGGGISTTEHVKNIVKKPYVDGIVIGRALHDNLIKIENIKSACLEVGRKVRR